MNHHVFFFPFLRPRHLSFVSCGAFSVMFPTTYRLPLLVSSEKEAQMGSFISRLFVPFFFWDFFLIYWLSRFLLTILLLISLRNHIFVLLENKTKRTLTMCRYYLINIIFWLDVRFVCVDWGPRRPCKEDSRSQTELSVWNSLAQMIIEVHAFWLVKCTLHVQCDIENWELNVFNEETCKTNGMQFLG